MSCTVMEPMLLLSTSTPPTVPGAAPGLPRALLTGCTSAHRQRKDGPAGRRAQTLGPLLPSAVVHAYGRHYPHMRHACVPAEAGSCGNAA